ncbi:MAG: hypothetical protein ACFFDW_08970 [Candidatus Thorarchaeota archaeon]
MNNICFNCKQSITDNDNPICPNCFAVQRNKFSRESIFNFLEIDFPTKNIDKERYTSTEIKLHTRAAEWWIIGGVFTLGVLYYYYLILTLSDLNDHWYYPHGSYENSTKTDIFTAMVILIFTAFLGVPFIQYMRYEKLRRHLGKAPPSSKKGYPIRGKPIFWLYAVLNLLFIIIGNMLFFGLSSILAGKFFQFDSNGLTIIFFMGAAILLILAILLAVILILFDIRWQEILNVHITWHINTKDAIIIETEIHPSDDEDDEEEYL